VIDQISRKAANENAWMHYYRYSTLPANRPIRLARQRRGKDGRAGNSRSPGLKWELACDDLYGGTYGHSDDGEGRLE
jgi:hypothetical protein